MRIVYNILHTKNGRNWRGNHRWNKSVKNNQLVPRLCRWFDWSNSCHRIIHSLCLHVRTDIVLRHLVDIRERCGWVLVQSWTAGLGNFLNYHFHKLVFYDGTVALPNSCDKSWRDAKRLLKATGSRSTERLLQPDFTARDNLRRAGREEKDAQWLALKGIDT